MPAAEMSFKNLILNMRCEATAQFLNMSVWKMHGGGEVDIASLQGRPCYAGLDLGATRDMTALVLVFAGQYGEFDVVPYCWLPGESLLEAQDRDRMPYGVWAHQGHLLTFPGRSTDPKAVALKIAELHGRYQIRALAYDRWRIEDLKRELAAIGCSVPLVPFGQGFKDLSPAVDSVGARSRGGQASARQSPGAGDGCDQRQGRTRCAGNRKLSKRRSIGRIDPLVALCMALGVAARPAPEIDVEAMIG